MHRHVIRAALTAGLVVAIAAGGAAAAETHDTAGDPFHFENANVTSEDPALSNDALIAEWNGDASSSSLTFNSVDVEVFYPSNSTLIANGSSTSLASSLEISGDNFATGQQLHVIVRITTEAGGGENTRQRRFNHTYEAGATTTFENSTLVSVDAVLETTDLATPTSGEREHLTGDTVTVDSLTTTSNMNVSSQTITVDGDTTTTVSPGGSHTFDNVSVYAVTLNATGEYGLTYSESVENIYVYSEYRYRESISDWEATYDETLDYQYKSAATAATEQDYHTNISMLVTVTDGLGTHRGTLYVADTGPTSIEDGGVYSTAAFIVTEGGEQISLASEWRVESIQDERQGESGTRDAMTITGYRNRTDIDVQDQRLIALHQALDNFSPIIYDWSGTPDLSDRGLIEDFRPPRSMGEGYGSLIRGQAQYRVWQVVHELPYVGDEYTADRMNASVIEAQHVYNKNSEDFQRYLNQRLNEDRNKSTMDVVRITFVHEPDDEEARVERTVYWSAEINSVGDYVATRVVNETSRSVDQNITIGGPMAYRIDEELRQVHLEYVGPNEDLTAQYTMGKYGRYGGGVRTTITAS